MRRGRASRCRRGRLPDGHDRLQRYAIDIIKIDQSFVRHLGSGSTELAVCRAIIVMAHELGLQVVAEGVETPEQLEQLEQLRQIGCDYAQGFLFSRPLPPAQFAQFMGAAAGACS